MTFTDLTKYMQLPVSFTLQEQSLKNFQTLRDINDFTLLHIAVLNNNVEKVLELLHVNYSTNLMSSNSEIPVKLIKKWIPFDFVDSMKIVFSEAGYTPIHLNLYLLNYYLKFKPEKKEFTIQQFGQKQLDILNLFIDNDPKILNQTDNKGFSVFDYAFLLENALLINKFCQLDPTFEGLNFVSPETAIKICHLINLKDKKIHKSKNNPISNETIENLNKKNLNKKLSIDLQHKHMIKCDKI